MIRGSYYNGFAPRDGMPLHPSLWRGCVGAWAPCLGPTGLTLRDSSAYRAHGTLTNMDANTDWPVSGGRDALDFDGVNDSVDFGVLSQTALVSNMSVSLWVNMTATTALQGLISQTGFSDEGWQIAVQSGTVRFPVWSLTTGAPTITAGVWTHICCVRRGTGTANNETWMNGILRNTQSATNRSSPTYQLTIGRLYGGIANYYLGGQVDDVMIFNRPLAGAEIQLLASRRGIAYDLAPFRMPYSEQVATAARLKRLLLLGVGS